MTARKPRMTREERAERNRIEYVAYVEGRRVAEVNRIAGLLGRAWTAEGMRQATNDVDPAIAAEALWIVVRRDIATIAQLHAEARDHTSRIDTLLKFRADTIAAGGMDGVIPFTDEPFGGRS